MTLGAEETLLVPGALREPHHEPVQYELPTALTPGELGVVVVGDARHYGARHQAHHLPLALLHLHQARAPVLLHLHHGHQGHNAAATMLTTLNLKSLYTF